MSPGRCCALTGLPDPTRHPDRRRGISLLFRVELDRFLENGLKLLIQRFGVG